MDEHIQHTGFKAFAQLIHTLGASTKTTAKLEALVNYFSVADDSDKVWTIAMFSGRKPKRFVSSTLLQQWCSEITGHPAWLFAECYHTVGDLSETIALLLPAHFVVNPICPASENTGFTDIVLVENNAAKKTDHIDTSVQTLTDYLQTFIRLEKQDEAVRRLYVANNWSQQDAVERFVFNKLISGNFRIGVSQQLVINALAKVAGQEAAVIAHRISGNWDPTTITYEELINDPTLNVDASKPYPFYLAYPIEGGPESLGEPDEWQAEWKWDGIRGQIIKRNGELFVWSRGEELMTEKFPEYAILKDLLPDGICLDGEIIAMGITAKNGDELEPMPANVNENTDIKNDLTDRGWKPLPFSFLQTRIGRKNISKKQLQEAPIGFITYDLLEYNGEDCRQKTMTERREVLQTIINAIDNPVINLSPVINFSTWEQLAETRLQSRDNNSEGIMLKRKSSAYQVGRKRGDWWKWKIDALTIDAVMIYAQKGSGRRSNLYTDYTFAVKDGDKLVSFAKAYGGLTDKEFAQVDNFVKRNSIEKFGPVRTVKPELVFEIAFEGIAASNRHKSGVALRFPRMSRWRKDKKPDEINTLEDLKKMLEIYGSKKDVEQTSATK